MSEINFSKMDTHHCGQCQILIFMCKPNSYDSNTHTININKQVTINLCESSSGFIRCIRCNNIIGEVNDMFSYNVYLEKVIAYKVNNFGQRIE